MSVIIALQNTFIKALWGVRSVKVPAQVFNFCANNFQTVGISYTLSNILTG